MIAPSTTYCDPETYELSLEARNSTTFCYRKICQLNDSGPISRSQRTAISSGLAILWNTAILSAISSIIPASKRGVINPVFTTPGCTLIQRATCESNEDDDQANERRTCSRGCSCWRWPEQPISSLRRRHAWK